MLGNIKHALRRTLKSIRKRRHFAPAVGPDMLTAFLRAHEFDGAAYASHYSDGHQLTPDEALEHFVNFGYREGRGAPLRLPMAAILALRQTHWHEAWQAEIGRRATWAALWTVNPNGNDFLKLTDLLSAGPDHLPAIMIGDSHSAFLNQAPAMLAAGIFPVLILCSGGSARGLQNTQSQSQYGAHILDLLARLTLVRARRPVVFKFGQVDMEFLFDLKRIKAGITAYESATMRKFIDDSIQRYAAFLAQCHAAYHGPMIVMGNFPPTLGDATLRAGYVNAHIAFLNEEDDIEQLRTALIALDHPPLGERTAMTRYWNHRLAEACDKLGLFYLEEFEGLLGKEGVVHPDLANPHDHHLQLGGRRIQRRITAVGAQLRKLARA